MFYIETNTGSQNGETDMSQLKEQNKAPENDEMEISNLPDAEVKTLVIRMLSVKTQQRNRKHKNGYRKQKRIGQK